MDALPTLRQIDLFSDDHIVSTIELKLLAAICVEASCEATLNSKTLNLIFNDAQLITGTRSK